MHMPPCATQKCTPALKNCHTLHRWRCGHFAGGGCHRSRRGPVCDGDVARHRQVGLASWCAPARFAQLLDELSQWQQSTCVCVTAGSLLAFSSTFNKHVMQQSYGAWIGAQRAKSSHMLCKLIRWHILLVNLGVVRRHPQPVRRRAHPEAARGGGAGGERAAIRHCAPRRHGAPQGTACAALHCAETSQCMHSRLIIHMQRVVFVIYYVREYCLRAPRV